MIRVSLHFDDGTKIDFNDEADALNHARVQGISGVVELSEEASEQERAILHAEDQLAVAKGKSPAQAEAKGKRLYTRKQFEAKLAEATEEEGS